MSTDLQFILHRGPDREPATVPIDNLVIAGWTGRDTAAIEHHIEELAVLGVARPSGVPLFYRVSASLLTQAERLQVLGPDSSGEAEPVLLSYRGETWLTLGSDHTDRRVEAYSVVVSKQMCAKAVARDAWRLADVAPRWDRLELRSWIEGPDGRVLYQEGRLSSIRTPADLVGRFTGGRSALPEGTAMFCGTLAAIGGIRPSQAFSMELADDATGGVLKHAYRSDCLPLVS